MKDLSLTIEPYQQVPEWDEFIENHPKGSIFHTTSMIRCELNTKRHLPYAYGALDQKSRLAAVLVAVKVSTLNGVAASMASRSIMYAEPLYRCDAVGFEGVKQLIQKHDHDMSRSTLFAEVRPLLDCPRSHDPFLANGYQRGGYINYEINLQCSETELFARMSQKRRNNVRSALRKGVSVKSVDMQEGLPQFYQLIAESYRRSQIPLVDPTFFKSVSEQFQNSQVRLLIAYYQDVPVATGCFLTYRNRVICWYAGTHRIPGVYSMTLVFWEAMRQFAEERFEVFDLAGAGWEGEEYGPGKFKAKFGGIQTNHGRYRKIYSPWKLKAADSIYSAFRGWMAPDSTSPLMLESPAGDKSAK